MSDSPAVSILLLEDEPLIAMDTEELLQNAGFDVVGVLSSCGEALTWLESKQADLAVLDINLRDGDCTDIAQILANRNIPFIVHSGSLKNSANHHPIFLKGHWVTKPALPADLIAAVESSLAMA